MPQIDKSFRIKRLLSRLNYLRRLKAKDRELWELNGLWHEENLILQTLQFLKNGNGILNEVCVYDEAQNELLHRKIERVLPETYPCGVLIKGLGG